MLVVEPSYKDHWEIPGGACEAGETPWRTGPPAPDRRSRRAGESGAGASAAGGAGRRAGRCDGRVLRGRAARRELTPPTAETRRSPLPTRARRPATHRT
ncbi:hypothetical protein [Amycolatopsis sp. NPDC050768]|uniref:hypothetical protein n=1 Tax=Amycolatopsis sp. NPDC050768 TaxID=3154839 RepID=UPI0033E1BFA8